jgi:hypothetical protein
MDLQQEKINDDTFGETYYHLLSNNPQYPQEMKLISKKHSGLIDNQYMKIYSDNYVTYDELKKYIKSGVYSYSLFTSDYGYSGQFIIDYTKKDKDNENYKCSISYNIDQLVILTDGVPTISYDIGDFGDYDFVKELDDSYITMLDLDSSHLEDVLDNFHNMGLHNWKVSIKNPNLDLVGYWKEIHADIYSIYMILKQRKDLMRIDPLYAKKYITKLTTDLYHKTFDNNIMLVKICVYFYLSVRTMNLPCRKFNANGIMLHPKYYNELSEKPPKHIYVENEEFDNYNNKVEYNKYFIKELYNIIIDYFA